MGGSGRTGLAAAVLDNRIFLLGGHTTHNPVKLMEVFEPGTLVESRGEWAELPPMLARRTYLTADALDNKIFAVGGSADGRTLNTIEVFDLEKKCWATWFSMPPMQTKRTLHGAAVGDSRLFVCGGFDGLRDLKTVECYDPSTSQWQWKTPLSVGRSYLATVVVQGRLYAIGGQDRRQEAGSRAHNSVEAFDLFSELWQPVAPLLSGRLGLAAATLTHEDGEECIYVCGGSDGSQVLNTVERFSAKEGAWSEVPPMTVPRLGHTCAVVNGKLYALGGYDGKETLETFECFDPKEGRWGPPMKMGAPPRPPDPQVGPLPSEAPVKQTEFTLAVVPTT